MLMTGLFAETRYDLYEHFRKQTNLTGNQCNYIPGKHYIESVAGYHNIKSGYLICYLNSNIVVLYKVRNNVALTVGNFYLRER